MITCIHTYIVKLFIQSKLISPIKLHFSHSLLAYLFHGSFSPWCSRSQYRCRQKGWSAQLQSSLECSCSSSSPSSSSTGRWPRAWDSPCSCSTSFLLLFHWDLNMISTAAHYKGHPTHTYTSPVFKGNGTWPTRDFWKGPYSICELSDNIVVLKIWSTNKNR